MAGGGWGFPAAEGEEEEEEGDSGVGGKVMIDRGSGGGGGGGGGRSIAERRAVAGFCAPRINTPRFRCGASPIGSPSAAGFRSPRLTIPPGISPTALLDSPVMLPNSQVLRSPTTGSFLLLPNDLDIPSPPPVSASTQEGSNEDSWESSFMFKSSTDSDPATSLQEADFQIKGYSYIPIQERKPKEEDEHKGYASESPDSVLAENAIVDDQYSHMQTCYSGVATDQINQFKDLKEVKDAGLNQLLDKDCQDENGTHLPTGLGKPSEDGYNWRKYGQKHVKGSEYPRSYYKCTHLNCQVKKKVERSHDGQITEIVYRGAHNHPKPQPSQRPAIGMPFSLSQIPEKAKTSDTPMKTDEESVWNTKSGCKDNADEFCWQESYEKTSSVSVVTDLSDPLSSALGKNLIVPESVEKMDLSSDLASDNDKDVATQVSMVLQDELAENESESKRRKTDSCFSESCLALRSVREPRVVVQTESEVDILDDGYRWRKYGQKVVKGNPNPRSYYKCTSPGCSVRKHVERAANDLKSVITTYEGKHNHEVPSARSGGQNSSGSSGSIPPTSAAQAVITIPGSANIRKPEPQSQDLIPHFQTKFDVSNGFLRPSNFGRLMGDAGVGASPCYGMKLPHFPHLQLRSFGMSPVPTKLPQGASTSCMVPEYPISFPVGFQRHSVPLPGFNYGYGNTTGQSEKHVLMQQAIESEAKLRRPKQEQGDDDTASYASFLPIDNTSATFFYQNSGCFQF